MSEPTNHGGKREGAGRKPIKIIPHRKPKPAPEVDLDKLQMLCELGANNEQIAAYFCLAVRSLQLLRKKHPEVDEVMTMGKHRGDVAILNEIAARLKKSDAVLIFTAKNRLKWTDRVQSEMSGPDGGPIETKDSNSAESMKTLDAFLKRVESVKVADVATPADTESP